MRKFLRYQGPLVIWAATIFVLSSMPKLPRLSLFPHTDKVAHAVFYGVLAWAAQRAFYHQEWWELARRRSYLVAIIFALVYGLTDEFHQSLVPGREPSLLDLAADLAGAVFAIGLIAWRRHSAGPRSASD